MTPRTPIPARPAVREADVQREEFPRPCKNCGNMAMIHNGKLVHVRGKRERCNIFRPWSFTRDAKGMVTVMHWSADVVIPDPPTPEQIDAQKLKEWQEIYGVRNA